MPSSSLSDELLLHICHYYKQKYTHLRKGERNFQFVLLFYLDEENLICSLASFHRGRHDKKNTRHNLTLRFEAATSSSRLKSSLRAALHGAELVSMMNNFQYDIFKPTRFFV